MGKTSRERDQQSSKSFEKAWKLYKKVWEWMKEIPWALRNTLKWACEKFDARDKKIWEWIERKERQKGKNTSWEVKKFFRNNILKILLWLWILTHWAVEVSQNIKEKKQEKIEITVDNETITIDLKEIFDETNTINDLKWSWKDWEDKRENRYLWNDEAWSNGRWLWERQKVIEWMCRMIESWDINMIFEKADEAWVPRQCIYLALTESWWQEWANSWVAKGRWQFTKGSAILFGLNEKWWPDNRWDKVLSTEAAMRHLKDNYNTVCNYEKQLNYNLSESDKWYLAFSMFNWSPSMVRAWMVACKWDINEYATELVKLAKKNNGRINWKKVDAPQNANYVARALAMQNAIEKTFKENDYNIQKVREAENITTTHTKTSADLMYEEYLNGSEWLTTEQKIQKLNEIKAKYDEEYNEKKISKKYHKWAIQVIDEEIEKLENQDVDEED